MEGFAIPAIKPVSDLHDYNKVLKECKYGEPVYLTKNGHGVFVIMDINDFEKIKTIEITAKR